MTKRGLGIEGSSSEPKKQKTMNNGTAVAQGGAEIDEDLHSRQLAVYGRESMRRLMQANVLIIGALGLGVETAKNIILAGVKSVTLHDKGEVVVQDLAAHFYLSEDDVGKNRAEACRDRLQELNIAVAVSASSDDLSEEFLSQFQVVLLTNVPLAEAIRVDDICRKHGIPFIRADIRGVFASVFCDFGPSFTVYDPDGEEPHTGIIAGITAGNPTIVTMIEDEQVEFEEGELVAFSEVVGMPELSDGRPLRVKGVKPRAHMVELDVDSTGFSEYVRGGIVTQVKESKEIAFKSLREALEDPGEFLMSDFSKFDRPPLLHLGFQALDAFAVETGRLPGPYDEADADRLVEIAVSLQAESKAEEDGAAPAAPAALPDAQRNVLKTLSYVAAAELSPMAAFLGGMVGQEVVKAASGKFTPLLQWFYFDSIESLPDEKPSADDVAPQGTRYDHQIAVFGKGVQATLEKLNLFLVGAGALGCEFLKNFAMMGVSVAEKGLITVTDDDVIEKSNLSRQFLFRDWNIGSSKSTVAAAAASAINPGLHLNALQNRVSPDTEEVFNDSFWEGLDLVVNALDNVQARLYVDSRCVYFCKPLLESGTLGTKCNTQDVIPRLTENYGASRDPPERQAPMCTLHSFPHNIQHCLTFARSEFEGLLEKGPAEANAFLADPTKYIATIRHASDAAAREQLEKVVDVLVTDHCRTFEDCITWARHRFQMQFHDRIAQLAFTFPEDAVTSTGNLFWSAPKRFPRPLVFDPADPSHASFVQAGAILRAEVFNIPRPEWAADAEKVVEVAAKVVFPPFVPKAGVKIETDPKANKEPVSRLGDDENIIEDLIKQLEAVAQSLPAGYRLNPVIFEKDDDRNYHMDLIAGLANMRGRNYSIPEVDKLKAKLIAGKIIPAIATTTAMATGLVCLELYKVVQRKKLEAYRNTFANLALPLFAMAEPIAPKPFKMSGLEWNLWDRWSLQGDLTVQEVLDWFKERKLEAYSISCGASLLYNTIFPKHKDRLNTKMSELVVSIAKVDIPDYRKHFDIVVACEDENDEDMDVPLVSIYFR